MFTAAIKVLGNQYLVASGGVAFINNSDSKAPTNILMHGPTKIDLHFKDLKMAGFINWLYFFCSPSYFQVTFYSSPPLLIVI